MSVKYRSSVGIKKQNVFTFEGRIPRATKKSLKISEVLLKSKGGEMTLTPEPSCSIHKESPKCLAHKHKQTQHLAIISQRENGLVCKSALALFLLFSSDDEFGSKEL